MKLTRLEQLPERLQVEFIAAIDLEYAKSSLAGTEGIEGIASAEDFAEWYLGDAARRVLAPNPFFDESYYRRRYLDVVAAIRTGEQGSGFLHFLAYGLAEGRLPNAMCQSQYRDHGNPPDPPVTSILDTPIHFRNSRLYLEFRRNFPKTNPLEYYNNIGRFCSVAKEQSGYFAILDQSIDVDFVKSQVPHLEGRSAFDIRNYYTLHVGRDHISPNKNFDEAFYRAFYYDVEESIANGQLLSGFQHYILAGQREGRISHHSLTETLEIRFPGITSPAGLRRAPYLEEKISVKYSIDPSRTSRTVNILCPDLNPDIFFGGYESLIQLIKQLCNLRIPIRIIKTETSDPSLNYLKFHARTSQKLEQICDLPSCSALRPIPVGPGDTFIAYSVWDVFKAKRLASAANGKPVVHLVQEYEPIFHEYNSVGFLAHSAYSGNTFPIFNSSILVDYFRHMRIGPFEAHANPEEGKDYSVFEHVLTRLPELDFDRPRTTRTVFFYARPEAHAGRNLFEVGVMALREWIRKQNLGPEWKFVGLGALSSGLSVALSEIHEMPLLAKLPARDYAEFVSEVDLCLSLMWAPHPSVIPFEFLQTGALVVTNEYLNRPVSLLNSFSANMVACSATLEGVVDALDRCIPLIGDTAQRKAARVRLGARDWDSSFASVMEVLRSKEIV